MDRHDTLNTLLRIAVKDDVDWIHILKNKDLAPNHATIRDLMIPLFKRLPTPVIVELLIVEPRYSAYVPNWNFSATDWYRILYMQPEMYTYCLEAFENLSSDQLFSLLGKYSFFAKYANWSILNKKQIFDLFTRHPEIYTQLHKCDAQNFKTLKYKHCTSEQCSDWVAILLAYPNMMPYCPAYYSPLFAWTTLIHTHSIFSIVLKRVKV